MKQQPNYQTKAKSQNRNGIQDTFSGALSTIISTPFIEGPRGGSNTLLVKNIGKDPPGRWHSPGVAYCLNPDNRPVSIKSNKTLFNIDYQIFKQIQNPNFFNN